MIVFDKLWEVMAKKNISTYALRERCGIDSKTVRRLKKHGKRDIIFKEAYKKQLKSH